MICNSIDRAQNDQEMSERIANLFSDIRESQCKRLVLIITRNVKQCFDFT